MDLNTKKNKQGFYMFLILLAAFFWGTTFVAQSMGADYVGAYTFLASRSWITAVILVPVALAFSKLKAGEVAAEKPEAEAGELSEEKAEVEAGKSSKEKSEVDTKKSRVKNLLCGSVCCGICLFAGAATQQIGIAYTTTAKSGFLTAMYVIIVPIISIVLGKKIKPVIFLSVALSVLGLYLLCIKGSLTLGKGDALTLACALFFALQILAVEHFINDKKVDAIALSSGQFFVEAILSTAFMFLFETVSTDMILKAGGAILYAAIFSGCFGFTLQIVAQKKLNPTLASIGMCMESVFSAIAGWIVLNQALSPREIVGCIIMFIAILISSLL